MANHQLVGVAWPWSSQAAQGNYFLVRGRKQGFPTKKYELFVLCQTFQAFLLLRGGNYVFESGKTLWVQKYSFFERAKAINISATTNEPQDASKFSTDIIIAPENPLWLIFLDKKDFLQ